MLGLVRIKKTHKMWVEKMNMVETRTACKDYKDVEKIMYGVCWNKVYPYFILLVFYHPFNFFGLLFHTSVIYILLKGIVWYGWWEIYFSMCEFINVQFGEEAPCTFEHLVPLNPISNYMSFCFCLNTSKYTCM